MLYIFKNANEAWSVLYDTLNRPIEEITKDEMISDFYTSSPRGRKCNELIGTCIRITNPKECLVWSKIRSLPPTYLAKEHLWYNEGSRDPKNAPSKIWNDLVNIDGDEKGLINSNYGHYIFSQKDNKNPELSVFDATVELLKKDPDSRQAIWQIPIMNHRQDADTPCTSSLHFLLRDNKLNCVVYMRSCDAWYGFPNDVTQFILWQMRLANALNVELGWYEQHFGSFHVYEENFVSDYDKYIDIMVNDVYITGKEGKQYFKFFDDRDYKEILNEILSDFELLSKHTGQYLKEHRILKNEQLQYMVDNMKISEFIH